MQSSDPPLSDVLRDDRPLPDVSLRKTLTRPQAILWNTPELAAYLNVKEGTIRYWVHIGYIPHIKFQSLVRFRKTDIDTWLDQRTAPGRKTVAKKISEEIVADLLDRPRRGRAPRAKI